MGGPERPQRSRGAARPAVALFPDRLAQSGSVYVSIHEGGATGDTLSNALREAAGIKSEPIGVDEIRQLVPGIAPEFKSGLFFPGTYQSINSFRLVQVFAEHLVRWGGTILRLTRRA
jgi:D-amino-acid dehydrogenase